MDGGDDPGKPSELVGLILETSPVAITVLDPEGEIVRANERAEAVLGLERSEITGRTYDAPEWRIVDADGDPVPNDDLPFARVVRTGEPVYGYEHGIEHPGGRGVWLSINAAPIRDGGDIEGVVATIEDVTEREEREREIERQRAELDRLNRINATLRRVNQELVRVGDREGLEAAVCERLTASEPYHAAWFGEYVDGRIEPREWAGLEDAFFEGLEMPADGGGPASEAVRTREVQVVADVSEAPELAPWRERFEGSEIESVAAVPVTYGDRVYGVLGVYASRANAFDDRERGVLGELGETIGYALDSIAAREDLERTNRRLETFASVVSHDLRNPINVAVGYLDRFREEGNPDDLDRVGEAIGRMDELIEDVLTLAREGEAVGEVEETTLGTVARAAWSTVETGGAALDVESDRALLADASRLQQLFENLFRNAVEHAAPDPAVRVGALPDGFYVEDDGPGIPEVDRKAVFEVGGREGRHFGLPIVRTIAEGHGWSVTVTEGDEGGARFEFDGVP